MGSKKEKPQKLPEMGYSKVEPKTTEEIEAQTGKKVPKKKK